MALHRTPAEHDADPPSGWTVRKSGRKWQLLSGSGGVLDTFETKKQAEGGKCSGFLFNLYQDEGRWFKGETPRGWKPYIQCRLEHMRRELRAERISYGDLHELQCMADAGQIPADDVELLEAAGVPEFTTTGE